MSSALVRNFGNTSCKTKVPVLKAGMIIEVHQKIKEGNKERVQIFRGTVIRVGAGSGIGNTFTVRKISEGIGVEKCFPIHAPSIVEVKILRSQKVRRAKLNFLRALSGKSLRLKEVKWNNKELEFAKAPEKEAPKAEVTEAAGEVKEESA